MAHSCPDCGSACYCGGDIDDCLIENTPEARHCQHWPMDDDADFDADYLDDGEPEVD